jgi:hypothetical protein
VLVFLFGVMECSTIWLQPSSHRAVWCQRPQLSCMLELLRALECVESHGVFPTIHVGILTIKVVHQGSLVAHVGI